MHCASAGATTERERLALLATYRDREAVSRGEGAVVLADERDRGPTHYDAPLVDVLHRYKHHLDQRAAARLAGGKAARVGLAASTVEEAWDTVQLFADYLIAKGLAALHTGDLEHDHAAGFVLWLGTTKGKSNRPRGKATIGKHCRQIKACFRWIDKLKRPRYLRDCGHFVSGFKAPRPPRSRAQAIPPDALRAFLLAALERESNPTVQVERRKGGEEGRPESYRQGVPLPDVPVSRVFILLAALGCRLGEAFALRWEEIDLELGYVSFLDVDKTGETRCLVLGDARQGEVAPELIPVLRTWRFAAGGRGPVIRSRSGAPAEHPAQGWKTIQKGIAARCNPQRLRRNWVSFAHACGIPSATAALWAGHDQKTAARWYLGSVVQRYPGRSMLAAMGLADLLAAAAGDSLRQVR